MLKNFTLQEIFSAATELKDQDLSSLEESFHSADGEMPKECQMMLDAIPFEPLSNSQLKNEGNPDEKIQAKSAEMTFIQENIEEKDVEILAAASM
jgi:hypothetical protein